MLYTYLHLLEKQFHITHPWEKVENLLFIHILENHFMPYAAILGGVFVPFSAHMHIGTTIGYLFYVGIYNKYSTNV